MDAAGYLTRHGWRGSGHSLDKSDRGLKKPLLVSYKQDQLGVGKKKNLVSDQWWMRAFDESLKELGTGKATTLQQVTKTGINRGGLYGFFVRGEGLSGTIGEDGKQLDAEGKVVADIDAGIGTLETSSGVSTPANELSEEPRSQHKQAKYARDLKRLRAKAVRTDAKILGTTNKVQLKIEGWRKPKGMSVAEVAAEAKQLKRMIAKAEKSGTTVQEQLAKQKGTVLPLRVKSKPKPSTLSEDRLTDYTIRAREKGVSVDAYIKRRAEKKAEKQAEKALLLRTSCPAQPPNLT